MPDDISESVIDRSPERGALTVALGAIWVLMFLTFSWPGREGPSGLSSLDGIAILKVASRGAILVALMAALVWFPDAEKRRRVIRVFLPFGLFVLWGTLSVLWSPLPAISLGQISGLIVLYALAMVVALGSSGLRDVSRVLRHTALVLLIMNAVLLGVDFAAHDLSGLNREMFSEVAGSSGLVHPTSAGAAASLGIVVVLAGALIWRWTWARLMAAPALLIHGSVLILAASRMALFLALFVGAALLLIHMSRALLAKVLLAVSLCLTLYLLIDPNLHMAEDFMGAGTAYASRGETAAQLSSLTGRTELWAAVWREIGESPLLGHGYFVTSSEGALDVWDEPSNRTAHNVILQVLVSTGSIGLLLFVAGFVSVLSAGLSGVVRHPDASGVLAFLAVLGTWFVVWGQLSESFMGPVTPESVLFFSAVGLLVGHVREDAPEVATENATANSEWGLRGSARVRRVDA